MATTADDVWQLLTELTTRQSELTAAQKETDLQLKEVSQQQKEFMSLGFTTKYLNSIFLKTFNPKAINFSRLITEARSLSARRVIAS